MTLPNNPISYEEAKTMIKSTLREKWKKKHNIEQEDNISKLSRKELVLRTGHCQFLSYMYRLGISHADECPCGVDIQTP